MNIRTNLPCVFMDVANGSTIKCMSSLTACFLLSNRKVYRHCSIQRDGKPTCKKYPPPLYFQGDAEFHTIRNLRGLDIFFRYQSICMDFFIDSFGRQTKEGKNHCTSLYIVGRALLQSAENQDLDVHELQKIEAQGNVNLGALLGRPLASRV